MNIVTNMIGFGYGNICEKIISVNQEFSKVQNKREKKKAVCWKEERSFLQMI